MYFISIVFQVGEISYKKQIPRLRIWSPVLGGGGWCITFAVQKSMKRSKDNLIRELGRFALYLASIRLARRILYPYIKIMCSLLCNEYFMLHCSYKHWLLFAVITTMITSRKVYASMSTPKISFFSHNTSVVLPTFCCISNSQIKV